MNYIEFEIGGKLRGFKFGLGFLGDIQKHFDATLSDMELMIQKNPLLFIPAMLYYGHKHAVLRKHQPVTFELFEFEDWIVELKDGISNENLLSAANAMYFGIQHITGTKEPVEDADDSKKK